MTVIATRVSVTGSGRGKALHTTPGGLLVVTNRDSVESVSLGPLGVTYAGGYELKPGETLMLPIGHFNSVYAKAATGKTVLVHVLGLGE